MEPSDQIPPDELRTEWFRPSSDLRDQECFVRLTHVPTGKVGVGAAYIGSGPVVRRKNLNVAYRALLKAMNQEEQDGE